MRKIKLRPQYDVVVVYSSYFSSVYRCNDTAEEMDKRLYQVVLGDYGNRDITILRAYRVPTSRHKYGQ